MGNSEMRIHRGSAVSHGFQANLTPERCQIVSIYFFSVHFVEKKNTIQ